MNKKGTVLGLIIFFGTLAAIGLFTFATVQQRDDLGIAGTQALDMIKLRVENETNYYTKTIQAKHIVNNELFNLNKLGGVAGSQECPYFPTYGTVKLTYNESDGLKKCVPQYKENFISLLKGHFPQFTLHYTNNQMYFLSKNIPLILY